MKTYVGQRNIRLSDPRYIVQPNLIGDFLNADKEVDTTLDTRRDLIECRNVQSRIRNVVVHELVSDPPLALGCCGKGIVVRAKIFEGCVAGGEEGE